MPNILLPLEASQLKQLFSLGKFSSIKYIDSIESLGIVKLRKVPRLTYSLVFLSSRLKKEKEEERERAERQARLMVATTDPVTGQWRVMDNTAHSELMLDNYRV